MRTTNFRAYARRAQRISGGEGIEFVSCLICGKHLRVISGRHLSTHGTDRETYMQEYRLSPEPLGFSLEHLAHGNGNETQ
jgi:hypothetical protein